MEDFEREKELKAFDETKLGVKALVDAGITKVPRIFHHPHDNTKIASQSEDTKNYAIPVIDLANIHQDPCARKSVVESIRDASETFGFFQIVNHGIPVSILNQMKDGVLNFFEQDNEVKKEFYTREPKPFMYYSNIKLYKAVAATWKDTFLCNMAPVPPKPEDLPIVCRDILLKYLNQVKKLGNVLFELLSEALGLNPSYLRDYGCADGLYAFGHYYPACPEPELTLGAVKHADVVFLTVLLQDHVGGLQILHKDMWIDVPPVPDALIINMGDLIQLVTNDKFKSVHHRVVANLGAPRVSIASFFGTIYHESTRKFGPIKELLSEDNPAKYRETSISEFVVHFTTKCPTELVIMKKTILW
ncbi:1-aminocyclopropane-1-carboxylate oxidase homolog 1-like isoform X3 [Vicia villosa]|uniref:1-aminocyclopropane-1-carboxylate oxidase homolog 1-like isoform X3 n=2 Tax=Vicia villosa TaxID=3911 RepID=UPI00273B1288|nr:1-aminocyclopropane-1-carboxylate oxidase homolog 1-like isoform X3 [Vicia villosa]